MEEKRNWVAVARMEDGSEKRFHGTMMECAVWADEVAKEKKHLYIEISIREGKQR
jgi:hypothetical protein